MEEDELDSWYEEEKQKVFDKYLQNIENNKNKEKLEGQYKEEMKKIRTKYKNLYEKSKKQSIIKNYVEKIKTFINKLKHIVLRRE